MENGSMQTYPLCIIPVQLDSPIFDVKKWEGVMHTVDNFHDKNEAPEYSQIPRLFRNLGSDG